MTKPTLRILRFSAIAGLIAGLTGCCSLIWTPGCPPVIVQQPQSQIAKAGETVKFTVVVSKPSHAFYQWQFNGSDVAGATNSTYTIPHTVDLPDVGEYQVRVWGSPTNKSDPAYLSIITGPAVRDVNVGTLTAPLTAFHTTNNSCAGAGFNRWNTNMPFDGPNVTQPSAHFPNPNKLSFLIIDTCTPLNSSQNDTLVQIMSNKFPPQQLTCTDNTVSPTPACTSGPLLTICPAVPLPTGTDASGTCRVGIFYKSSTIPAGQSTISFNWKYTSQP